MLAWRGAPLDVHKDGIDIAVADAPRGAEVRHLGTVCGGVNAVTKSMREVVGAGHKLHIVYEAGPCGFVLQRHFAALGWDCHVVVPSRFHDLQASASRLIGATP